MNGLYANTVPTPVFFIAHSNWKINGDSSPMFPYVLIFTVQRLFVLLKEQCENSEVVTC